MTRGYTKVYLVLGLVVLVVVVDVSVSMYSCELVGGNGDTLRV